MMLKCPPGVVGPVMPCGELLGKVKDQTIHVSTRLS